MFLFSCCTEGSSNEAYQIRTKRYQQNHFQVMKAQDRISRKSIPQQTQVIKVKKSQYSELIKLHTKQGQLWEDPLFPPNNNSLGQIQGVSVSSWRRLSTIIPKPVLFDGKIQPQDVVQGLLGDCYFLSAVAAIAEREDRIKSIFGKQDAIKNAIYRVTLRVNGVVEEILVDDFVPVNSQGEPLFCQPNKNQIWVPILEKAWAKANGSYANIVAGTPSQIFRAALYAPAETVERSLKEEDNDLLWRRILQNARLNQPCCCGTDDSLKLNWEQSHLVPGHAYTLIDAVQLQKRQGQKVRMLKLRNPWGNTEWQGEGCEKDFQFWDDVIASETKTSFLRGFTINNDGIFYIRFKDYCKYFTQAHFCYLEEQGNYIYEDFQPSPKRGIHWSLQILQEGDYWLELHQTGSRGEAEDDESSLARETLVLAKNKQHNDFQLVDGVLTHYRADCSLRVKLTAGNYTIFTKFDSSQGQKLPFDASISIYSRHYAILDRAEPSKVRPMLKQCMLNHAIHSKRRRYENDTLWISWKLMYKEGGYAYICFGVEKEAQHRWSVSFDQSDFQSTHFRLKKPWKNRGNQQVFQVLPGDQKLIMVRIKNDNPKTLKWPPKITYKVQPLN